IATSKTTKATTKAEAIASIPSAWTFLIASPTPCAPGFSTSSATAIPTATGPTSTRTSCTWNSRNTSTDHADPLFLRKIVDARQRTVQHGCPVRDALPTAFYIQTNLDDPAFPHRRSSRVRLFGGGGCFRTNRCHQAGEWRLFQATQGRDERN